MSVDLKSAHTRSSNHRVEIETSAACGCFYCLAVFPPRDIKQWVDEDTTALCPRCGVDSVIGDASGYEIGREFLAAMQAHWF